jgi:hypothetical protein
MNTKQISNGTMDVAGKSYHLKCNIRAIVLFEKMTDKPFTLACTTDWVIFLYAMLLSGTPGATITLDEFMDDISQQQLHQATIWASEQMKNEEKTV